MTEEKPKYGVDVVPDDHMPTEADSITVEGNITPFEGDYMEVTVQVAKRLEEYEKALNIILNFIVRRTYPGDWVSHDKESTAPEDRTVNMIGAAAERIARDLGISETNRTQPIKIMDENHPGHYSYRCEGDFTFRGRTVHAIGMASTRNPFYSKAYGEEKKPGDIREEYVVRECLRDCTKQGIKGLFGLRRIPLMKLKELGYDISKVKYVNFKESEKSQSAKNPSATAVPQGAENPVEAAEVINLTIESMAAKVSKGGKSFHLVKDTEGASYYVWGNSESETVKALKSAMESAKPIGCSVETKDGFSTIKGVRP